MGRLLKEKEMLPYKRGTGELWNSASYTTTDKIAKLTNTYNDLAWKYTYSSYKLASDTDFTKKDTYIELLNPSQANGRDGNWGIGGKFIWPLWSPLSELYMFTSTSTYNSNSTLFKPECYLYCANSSYPTTITLYNSSGTGTTINISDYVSSYNSIGCAYEPDGTILVLGFKIYFLKYGDLYGYPNEPWEYLEYEGGSEDFYTLAQSSDFIIGDSCLNKSYWPSNFSTYRTAGGSSGGTYYDARDTSNVTDPIYVYGGMKIGGLNFYTSGYDLMCLEIAMMDVTSPGFTYYTSQGLTYHADHTDTAIRPVISPLAPNVSLAAEQLCCNYGKVNIAPLQVITNLPSKGYVNNYKLLYAFISDSVLQSSSVKRNHAIWATANTYGLFYVIPLVADNPYIYAPNTSLLALSNNRIGLYFHTGESGTAMPYNRFLRK